MYKKKFLMYLHFLTLFLLRLSPGELEGLTLNHIEKHLNKIHFGITCSSIHFPINFSILGCAYMSLGRPGRKQATATGDLFITLPTKLNISYTVVLNF